MLTPLLLVGLSLVVGEGHASCLLCPDSQMMQQLHLQSIRDQILQKLDLKRPPNITGKQLPSISKDWLREHMQTGPVESSVEYYQGDVDRDPDVTLVFPSSDKSRLSQITTIPQLQDNILVFELPKRSPELRVQKAFLWLYQNSRNLSSPRFTVQINKVTLRGGKLQLKEFVVEKLPLSEAENGYKKLDVTGLAQDWWRYPEDNRGLVVRALSPGGILLENLLVSSHSQLQQRNAQMPILELTLTTHRRRHKRRTESEYCPDDGSEPRCCRYPLQVDFRLYGWSWVISPIRYEANFCAGECPALYMQHLTHTHLAQQSGAIKPCCSPRRLEPLHMIYWTEDGTLRYRKLPDMRVVSCGCN